MDFYDLLSELPQRKLSYVEISKQQVAVVSNITQTEINGCWLHIADGWCTFIVGWLCLLSLNVYSFARIWKCSLQEGLSARLCMVPMPIYSLRRPCLFRVYSCYEEQSSTHASLPSLRRQQEAAGEINNAIHQQPLCQWQEHPSADAQTGWNRAYWTHSTRPQWETADPLGSGSDLFDPFLGVTPICSAVMEFKSTGGVGLRFLGAE